MAGYFYPLPPTSIGGRQPYAPKLGIVQSGPPSQPARALATLGIILASWAQAAPAFPQQVKIAPLLPVVNAAPYRSTANLNVILSQWQTQYTPPPPRADFAPLIALAATESPPYTRKQFENIDATWRADVTTVITLTSIAPFADPPPDPDVAPIKGYKTVDLILGQWKAREYLPTQPKGLAPLLPVAAVPDYPPPTSYARLNLLLQQWTPRAWWPLPRSPALVAPTPDAPPALGGANFDIIAEQWQADVVRLPQGAKFAPLLEPITQSDAPPTSSSSTNFATIVGWWERSARYELPTLSSWMIHVDGNEYPTVHGSRSIRLPSGGVWVVDPDVLDWCEIIWASVLPPGVTLVSVAYTLPASLTLADEEVDLTLAKSAILVSGATHGSMNQVQVLATLSNGMTIAFTAPLRCFNG